MADSGKSKKAGRSKKGELGKLTTAKHRARRIKREEAWQALCAKARALGNTRDIQRAVRKLRRAARGAA